MHKINHCIVFFSFSFLGACSSKNQLTIDMSGDSTVINSMINASGGNGGVILTGTNKTINSNTKNTNTKNTNTKNTNTKKTNGNITNNRIKANNTLNGAKLISTKGAGNVVSNDYYQSDLTVNQLMVDGQFIELLLNNQKAPFLSINSDINGIPSTRWVSDRGYDSRFGVLQRGEYITAFSQGQLTEHLPVGKGIYRGDYVGYDHVDDVTATGKIDAQVNFDSGSMSLTLSDDSAGNSGGTLSGRLSGNQFTVGDGNAQGKGHFYGDKASELGGTCVKKGVYSAAFGAKK